MKTKTRDYEIFRMPPDGRYIRAQVVGETPAGLEAGRSAYLREFSRHEARVERGTETSLTCIIRRRQSC
jgi:hypothetical protein